MSFVNIIYMILIINVNIINMTINYILSLFIRRITKVCINKLLSEKILNKLLIFFEVILTKLVDVD